MFGIYPDAGGRPGTTPLISGQLFKSQLMT
jgi:hypothetical protein